ncbi:MAG: hypothetical protein JWR52_1176 [Marmoricola sp.]|nr:hypothetical protein [Marmoricola sp.]
MSQPALSRPKSATIQPAVPRQTGLSANSQAGSAGGSTVTYGDLLDASREAAAAATQLVSPPHGKGLAASVVGDELDGYERFLATATRHIQALLRIAEIPAGPHWDTNHVPEPGTSSDRHRIGAGYWHRAAETLGTAHDLAASHFTGVYVPRTVEAQEAVIGPAAAATCVDVTTFLLDAIAASAPLIRTASRTHAQHHPTGNPIKLATFGRLQQANRRAAKSARSTLWELRHLNSGNDTGTTPTLRQLRPALQIAGDIRSAAFETSLDALRLLREIARHQASTEAAASPASLRDLTLLGSRVISRAIDHSTALGTKSGLDSVRRAHALDLLEAAHEAWGTAGTGLSTSIRGLTRAPAAYAEAVTTLVTNDPSGAEQRALMVALPALARDAAQVVEHLTAQGNLVTLQRDRLATRHAWRPITREQGHHLATQFKLAERTTKRAATALLALEHTPTIRTSASRRHEDQVTREQPRVEAASWTR